MRCLIYPIGSLFLILLPACFGRTNVRNITTDQHALLAFQNRISDTDQILSRNWSVLSSVCEWMGVTCGSRHYRVTSLNVSYMGLSGNIPPQLGNLSFLVSLDLSGNGFHGELPNELSYLRRLKALNFSYNNFSGEIPSWLGSLRELQFLTLKNNTFAGSIPTSVSNLSNLEYLSLSSNSLQGNIPTGIRSLHNLKMLIINHNQISGSIPHEMFNISSLEVVSLVNNSLFGSLPTSMCNRPTRLKFLSLSRNILNGQIPDLSQCSELQILSLSFNQFDGFIPKEIGSLKALEELYLGDNNLQGEIPREIGNLTLLTELSIPMNHLSGVIPGGFNNLYNLEYLDLTNNTLSGSILLEIFNLSTVIEIFIIFNNLSGNLPSDMCLGFTNLEILNLSGNNLHGALPESISNCSKLKELSLGANKLVGSIPNSLGNLRLLEYLNLAENYFTSHFPSLENGFINHLTNCEYLRVLNVHSNPLNGKLPESVGNLSTSLQSFYAYNCNIKGKIPQGFGNLSSLIVLTLYGNQLTGSIPKTIKNLQQLQALDLSSNELSRAMLDELCGMPKLWSLYLSQNKILEPIPECLGNITSLRYLYLDSNRVNSTLPANLWNLKDLLELNLSSNYLSGSLPLEVGNLKVLILLDLSVNNLSSGIPSTIGDLQDLNNLSLAFNRFQESIPESMGNMISLETLDLSHNNLSGLIPDSLEKIRTLIYLNVSFNTLRGQIPSEGPFENFTGESFISNEALCGPQRFHVPPCPTMSSKKSRTKNPLRTILICVGIAATLGLLAFALVCLRCRKKISRSSGDGLSLLGEHERISFYELQQATDGYDEGNLLGTGAFGSVYRGLLKDGRMVAVKVFNLQFEKALKSFDVECQVLRSLHHRNLTKVISSCSNTDFKALVLEFMPNGSLDKWLHSKNFSLDMKQRLNIMIDVATALQYLHSGYSPPIVHCDLKPSNVLLDQEMVAHVSDFGIAKFLSQEDSFTCTATIATFGYIAPEYGLEGLVSTKCDVYSYGIMLMEVFMGIRPTDGRFNSDFSLKDMVDNSMPNALYQIVDASLFQDGEELNSEEFECISSIMEIALTCTRESSKERSTIDQVVNALSTVKSRLISM